MVCVVLLVAFPFSLCSSWPFIVRTFQLAFVRWFTVVKEAEASEAAPPLSIAFVSFISFLDESDHLTLPLASLLHRGLTFKVYYLLAFIASITVILQS